MDGVHDMGGMDGFGPVVSEPVGPSFHHAWEGRVMAMNRALGAAGAWNIDMSRFSRERLPPTVYLSSTYFERWQLAMERLLVERGYVGDDELQAGRSFGAGVPLPRGAFTVDHLEAVRTRGSFTRPAAAAPRFAPGDHVRARNIHPATHTRLPRYVRGRLGTVERVQGHHVFPDMSALGHDDAHWLYTVRFRGQELWGEGSDPALIVSVEAFEPYLDPA